MSGSAGVTILASSISGTGSKKIRTLVSMFSVDEINYFESVYRPYINFSILPVEVAFDGKMSFGQKVKARLSHNNTGDLLYNAYFKVTLPSLTYVNANNVVLEFDDTQGGWTNSIGHALIDTSEVEVNNQIVDTQMGLWMEVWNELTVPSSKQSGINDMIGKFANIGTLFGNAREDDTYIIPLNYWFCRDIGSSLPLVQMTRSQVSINIKLRNFTDLTVLNSGGDSINPTFKDIVDGTLLCEYVFLDIDERKKYKASESVFLIDYIQYSGAQSIHPNATESTLRFEFMNPIKSLYWVIQEQNSITNNDYFNFSRRDQTGKFTITKNEFLFFKKLQLVLDSEDITPFITEKYFRDAVPADRHTSTPGKHIYSYAHALYPEAIQPSSFSNYSEFNSESTYLKFKMRSLPRKITKNTTTGATISDVTYDPVDTVIHIFALTYNIFTIHDGVGSVVFRN